MLSLSLSTLLTLLLSGVIVSFILGYKLRDWLGLPSKLEKTLSNDLLNTKTEYKNYKQEVNHHFEKTAELFNNMLLQSRQLYEHLVDSSGDLCDLNTEETKKLQNNKTSSEKWPQISIKSKSADNNPEHNWHPTYFEAKEAKELKNSDVYNNELDETNSDNSDTSTDSADSNKPNKNTSSDTKNTPELTVVEN